MRYQKHSKIILFFIVQQEGPVFSIFLLLYIYSETQNDGNEKMMWTKWGGGAQKLFRNYYHTPMTADIKLENHNVENLKPQKKFLGLLLDI